MQFQINNRPFAESCLKKYNPVSIITIDKDAMIFFHNFILLNVDLLNDKFECLCMLPRCEDDDIRPLGEVVERKPAIGLRTDGLPVVQLPVEVIDEVGDFLHGSIGKVYPGISAGLDIGKVDGMLHSAVGLQHGPFDGCRPFVAIGDVVRTDDAVGHHVAIVPIRGGQYSASYTGGIQPSVTHFQSSIFQSTEDMSQSYSPLMRSNM